MKLFRSLPSLIRFSGILWILEVCALGVNGRNFANEPGSASLTTVTHFAFLQHLGNPCGISRGMHYEPTTSAHGTIPDTSTQSSPEFYQSMLTSILLALDKLKQLENSDPNLTECNGLYLTSLIPTPSFINMNVNELFGKIYLSGIYLAAHLHIMAIDRQMQNNRRLPLPDDQFGEDVSLHGGTSTSSGDGPFVPLRCGNESDSIINLIGELTENIEDIICTLLLGSNLEQRASYRQPYNSLLRTQIYRYHSSCSLLQTRDCLVVKETKNTLINMVEKFNKLVLGTDVSQISSDLIEFDNRI